MPHQAIIHHSVHRVPSNPTQCAACGALVRWPRERDSETVDTTCSNPDCEHVTTFLLTDGQVTGIVP
jgi:hypothetical protein